MYSTYLIIFVLLFPGSWEVTISGYWRCDRMTISDALPVQFWLINCDTFNESEPCGIHQACFCQPIQCDDHITVQFTDSPAMDYTLRIRNDEDELLETIEFSEDGVTDTVSVYQASFTLTSLDICDGYIKMHILDGVSIVAKSDCLDVRTTHECTKLIEYSNSRNFAGLIYGINESPDTVFYLRVPARFFHERFPEEDEAIELTGSVVTTSAQVKSQKLIEVQHVPYYFHRKLMLVLKHQNLLIDNTYWQKEESYEITPGNKRWPLKTATCNLTLRNSVVRNVI